MSSYYRITVQPYWHGLLDSEIVTGLVVVAGFAYTLKVITVICPAFAYWYDVVNLNGRTAFADTANRFLDKDNMPELHPSVAACSLVFFLVPGHASSLNSSSAFGLPALCMMYPSS